MILHMINKTSLKFVGIFVVVIIAASAAIYYANYYFSPEQKALRYYAELERQYREDTYGGKTPEETLQLFIDALKAGDIELASKYFVVEEKERRRNELITVKDKGELDRIVERAMELNLSKIESNRAWFVVTNEHRVIKYEALLDKNINGVWKITSI